MINKDEVTEVIEAMRYNHHTFSFKNKALIAIEAAMSIIATSPLPPHGIELYNEIVTLLRNRVELTTMDALKRYILVLFNEPGKYELESNGNYILQVTSHHLYTPNFTQCEYKEMKETKEYREMYAHLLEYPNAGPLSKFIQKDYAMNNFQKLLFTTFSKSTVEEFDAKIGDVVISTPEDKADVAKMRSMLVPVEKDIYTHKVHIYAPLEQTTEALNTDDGFYKHHDYQGRTFSFLETDSVSVIALAMTLDSITDQVDITGLAGVINSLPGKSNAYSDIDFNVGNITVNLVKREDSSFYLNPFDVPEFSVHRIDLDNLEVYDVVKK